MLTAQSVVRLMPQSNLTMLPDDRRSLLTLVLASLLLTTTSMARADVIERVVAVVDDQAIFLSQLRRRAVPYLPQTMDAATETERRARLDELYARLLDQLIEEELIQGAAREMQVRVSTEDVNRAISNVRAGSDLSEEQFWEAVRTQGFSESQYRSDVRRQLLRLKVLNQRVRGRVNITEEDVHRKYAQAVRESNQTLRFQLAHVFFLVPQGASATEVTEVRRRAEEARSSISGSEQFAAAVSQYGGGDLGWLRQGDLPQALEQAVLAMQPGGISSPIRGPNGYHLLMLREREVGGTDVPEFSELRDQIHRQMLEEAMARQQIQLLSELRREATITRRLFAEED